MLARDTGTAASTAYETIKRCIIECVYPPGSKLSEERLAFELKLGRSPVRSAFARLNGEGWIDISPQSGTYVKVLSERELAEIIDLRMLLETHVTRLAARNITDEQLRKLRLGLKRVALAATTGFDKSTFDEFDSFDSVVHLTIYEAADNSLVSRILVNLFEKARWVKKAVSPSTPERMKAWLFDLERVVEALELHDADLAVQRVCEHIRGVAQTHYSAAARDARAALTHRQERSA